MEKDGLRQNLACLVLLGYNLVVSFFLGNECNVELCKNILDEKLTKYPNGSFFLFFKGRFHFIQVHMDLCSLLFLHSTQLLVFFDTNCMPDHCNVLKGPQNVRNRSDKK